MNDHDELADSLAELIDGAADPLALAEVVERARQGSFGSRPRPARRLVAAGVAVAVVAVAIAVTVVERSQSAPKRPASISVVPTTTTTTPVSETTTATTPIESGYAHAIPTGEMGIIGPGSAWRLDGLALTRTDDDGVHWRDITPPATVGQDPIARIESLDFLDSNDVWAPVALNDSPFTIYRSTDGGTTWHAVCRGNQCGGSADLTFLDAEHGWAIGYNGSVNGGTLYATTDGGHTWADLGPAPFIGPMQFVDASNGWGVSDPSGYGETSGLPTVPGGTLYRTGDGGRTWQAVQLSAINGAGPVTTFAGVPQFFGESGVVVAWLQAHVSGLRDQIAVYTTHDGGATWAGQLAPSDNTLERYGETTTHGRDLTAPNFPFSASSPTDWMLFLGPNLYVTHDAGQHWETLTPSPAIGMVQQVSAMSAAAAWALAVVPTCATPTTVRQGCSLETMVHTTDGGQTWPAVPLPPEG